MSLSNFRYAIRTLARNPGFTVTALLALALGIGANTAIFSVVYAVLLKPLPYPSPERLVQVWGQDPKREIRAHYILYADFVEWRERSRSFESAAAYSAGVGNVAGTAAGNPEQAPVWRVSASYFRTIGVRPLLGRDFLDEEDHPGARKVAILSDSLWKRQFGANPALPGRDILIDSEPYTVVGVLPAGFDFAGRKVDVFVPIARAADYGGPAGPFSCAIVARLKPGVTLRQAQSESDTITDSLNPPFFKDGGRSLRIWGAREFVVRDVRVSLLVLLGAVGLVLLIACANVANLLLARAGAREREIAIRTALGAARWRLLSQMLTESAMLGLAGGLLGLGLAAAGVRALVAAASESYPLLESVRMDAGVLGFTLLVSLTTGLLFGTIPALAVSRGNLHDSLKEGGRGGEGGARHRLRSILVVAEMALALLLAVGAGLLMKAFLRLQQVNPGFEVDGLLTATVNLPAPKYRTPQQRMAFFDEMLGKIRSTPGVRAAGIVNLLPLSGSNTGAVIHIEGKPEPRAQDATVVWMRSADAAYFTAMHIPLRRGRMLSEQDRENAPPVAVINEAMAKRFWGNEDPVGRRLAFGRTHRPARPGGPAPSWIQVIGIVGDVRHMSLTDNPEPEIFLSCRQFSYPNMSVAVRTTADPIRFAPVLRQAVSSTDPAQAISRVASMAQTVSRSMANRRLSMLLLGIFAAIAVALAAVGIYGVMAFVVTRRTQEIGIRMALGAETGSVLRMVVRQAMLLAGTGIGIGMAAALLLTRILRSLLFGITATDPLVFAGVAAFLAAVALLASFVPALRAARVDPLIALRYE